ncbi:hypothetical protein KEM55_006684, partial [Ascosphaera atra]
PAVPGLADDDDHGLLHRGARDVRRSVEEQRGVELARAGDPEEGGGGLVGGRAAPKREV